MLLLHDWRDTTKSQLTLQLTSPGILRTTFCSNNESGWFLPKVVSMVLLQYHDEIALWTTQILLWHQDFLLAAINQFESFKFQYLDELPVHEGFNYCGIEIVAMKGFNCCEIMVMETKASPSKPKGICDSSDTVNVFESDKLAKIRFQSHLQPHKSITPTISICTFTT